MVDDRAIVVRGLRKAHGPVQALSGVRSLGDRPQPASPLPRRPSLRRLPRSPLPRGDRTAANPLPDHQPVPGRDRRHRPQRHPDLP